MVVNIVLWSVAVSSQWRQLLNDAPWSKRSDPQLAVLSNDQLVLMGGHANNEYYNDVWSSVDGGLTWRLELATAPWAPRSYHTAKVFMDRLVLLAGHDQNTWYNDVWASSDGIAWECITPAAAFQPRAAAALQPFGDKIFLMGGSDGLLAPLGNGTLYNDVWVADSSLDAWTLVTPAAPWPQREGLQKLTAVYAGMIVMTAGEAGYTGPYFNDVWGTADGANWRLLNPHADFSARSGNLLLNARGDLYTFGGFGVPMKHDAYCLANGNASQPWQTLPSAPWHGRFDYDMVVVGNGSTIVLLGGEASLFGTGGPYFNDVWAFDVPGC